MNTLQKPKKLNNIEFVRFILSFIILYFHTVGSAVVIAPNGGAEFLEGLSNDCSNAGYAVECFFIIAGYFLFQSYYKNPHLSVKEFAYNKFARLWPVLFVVTTVYVLFYGYPEIPAFFNILFLQCIGVSKDYQGITWYISPFFWVMLFYFVLLKCMKDKKICNLIIGILVYFSYVILVNNFFGRETIYGVINLGVLRALGGIGTGYLTAVCLESINQMPFVKSFQASHVQKILIITVISVVEIGSISMLIRHFFAKDRAYENQFFVVIVFTLLLICLLSGEGIFSRLCNNKFCGFLGQFSYSIYVMQQISFYILRDTLWEKLDWVYTHPLRWLTVSLMFSVLLGILVYYIVERPAARSMKKIGEKIFMQQEKPELGGGKRYDLQGVGIMLFNSFEFLVFFPLVVMIYFVLPLKWRWIWLLISSYYFYMCWNPIYILLLLFSTGVSYIGGRLLGMIHTEGKRKIVLALAVVINFSVLFWFKYLNFFCYTCNQVLQRFSIGFRLPEYDILLPVGISFFTFQAVGYVIDVYKGRVKCETNFLRYALFVSFFPQLVAGPIERSGNLMHQLHEVHRFDWERIKDGLVLMLWGFFLKLVVADRAAVVVNGIWKNPDEYQGSYILVALFLFAFQIYGDFAGYSTIAQGAAKVLDIRLMDNFKAPYLSQSVTEFWRNWHISLSSWFRDYVYIPLGGNRKGTLRKYVNVMIVFAGSGLWHGASWNYVAWGIINGFYQIAEDIWRKAAAKLFKNGQNRRSVVRRAVQTAFTFILVDFSWLFFRAGSFSEVMRMIKSVCRVHNPKIFFDGSLLQVGLLPGEWILLMLSIILVLVIDGVHRQGGHMRVLLAAKPVWMRWIIYTVLFWTVVMFGIYGVSYEASAFIYFQF